MLLIRIENVHFMKYYLLFSEKNTFLNYIKIMIFLLFDGFWFGVVIDIEKPRATLLKFTFISPDIGSGDLINLS